MREQEGCAGVIGAWRGKWATSSTSIAIDL